MQVAATVKKQQEEAAQRRKRQQERRRLHEAKRQRIREQGSSRQRPVSHSKAAHGVVTEASTSAASGLASGPDCNTVQATSAVTQAEPQLEQTTAQAPVAAPAARVSPSGPVLPATAQPQAMPAAAAQSPAAAADSYELSDNESRWAAGVCGGVVPCRLGLTATSPRSSSSEPDESADADARRRKAPAGWASGTRLEAAIYAQFNVKSVDPTSIFHDDAISGCDLEGEPRNQARVVLEPSAHRHVLLVLQPFSQATKDSTAVNAVGGTTHARVLATGSQITCRTVSGMPTTRTWAFRGRCAVAACGSVRLYVSCVAVDRWYLMKPGSLASFVAMALALSALAHTRAHVHALRTMRSCEFKSRCNR